MIDEEFEGEADPERMTIATGLLAAPYLEKQAARIMERHPKMPDPGVSPSATNFSES